MLSNTLTNRHGESTADHVAEDVIYDNVEIERLKDALLLEYLDSRDDATPRASDARCRATRFDAIDTGEPFEDQVIGLHLPPLTQGIQHGGDVLPAPQRIGRIAFGVAPELHDAITGIRERRGNIRRGGGFPDATFAINGDLLDDFRAHELPSF